MFVWKPVTPTDIILSALVALVVWAVVGPVQAVAIVMFAGFLTLITEKNPPTLEFGNTIRRLCLQMTGPLLLFGAKLAYLKGESILEYWALGTLLALIVNLIGAPRPSARAMRELR